MSGRRETFTGFFKNKKQVCKNKKHFILQSIYNYFINFLPESTIIIVEIPKLSITFRILFFLMESIVALGLMLFNLCLIQKKHFHLDLNQDNMLANTLCLHYRFQIHFYFRAMVKPDVI